MRKSKSGCCRLCGWIIFALVGSMASQPSESMAQAKRLPPLEYYRIFTDFYRADYRSAQRDFERGAGTLAYRKGQQRFLDSVCYWTMMGECYYHTGNYAQALTMYEQSLQLYLLYTKNRWQDRVRLPAIIQAESQGIERARITWYRPQRTIRKPRLPDEFSVLFGRLDAARAFEEGGVFDPAELRTIDVTEIMRCVALSIHRRRVIRGPTCKYDPFTAQLVNGLSAVGRNSTTVLGAYNGVLLGLAEASLENWDRAAKLLKGSLRFGAGFDHPLTPVAFMESANIAMATGNDAVAGKLAMEASYSAGLFDQFDMVEESLGLATMLYLKTNRTPFAPLRPAIDWAARRRAGLLHASLQVRLAECFAEAGDAAVTATVLQQAKRAVTREKVPDTIVASRYRYVSAMARFLEGDVEAGRKDLEGALNAKGNGSLGRFRLSLTDRLVTTGVIGERQSDLLYTTLLQDPTAAQWQLDPFETMSSLVFPQTESLERWFEIVVSRKDYGRALEIAEKLRRYRFYSQLPLSGRLLSFRWMLHGPTGALSKEALSQRTQFLTQHPAYVDLQRRADLAMGEIDALPLVPAPNSDQAKKQVEWLAKLSKVSLAQESYLASVALHREPADMVFPPQREIESWRKSIKPGQLALVTVATAASYHLFLVDDQGIRYLDRVKLRSMKSLVGNLVKSLSVSDPVLDAEKLAEPRWPKAAAKLKQALWKNISDDQWATVKELVIVPDGLVWYVPFEVLPINSDANQPVLLADQIPVSYSPTLFLAFQRQTPRPAAQNKVRRVLLSGRLSQRGDIELVNEQVKQLKQQWPDIGEVKRLPAPSGIFAAATDQWLAWSGLNLERGKASLIPVPELLRNNEPPSLRSWVSLPWDGPQQVLMPGFQSDAGLGLRGQQRGTDLFFTTCGLLASGVRQVLINRWNTGGDTSLRMANEFSKRLPTMSGAQALHETKLWARQQSVTETSEPKLRLPRGQTELKIQHPVFWAGPMVVGVSAEPTAEESVAKPPAAEDAAPVAEEPPPGT